MQAHKVKRENCGKTLLDRIRVRMIQQGEREEFDRLLEQRHYLKSSRIGGRHVRYVAEVDGRWIALLAFSGAAPHLKGREQHIGWSPRQRARRLSLVVNNSRYLLLEERGSCPNLASKVLSMALRRLSNDWQRLWGHPVAVVESFVDEGRYEGTCYRACGFVQAGQSAGFSRDRRDYYSRHDQPKALYIKELEPGALKSLRAPRLPRRWAGAEADIAGPCPFRAAELVSLLESFRAIEDPRSRYRSRHRLTCVLACATVAMLLGAGSYLAFEDVCRRLTQRQLRALGCHRDSKTGRFVPPGDSTFFRVLNRIDAGSFELVVAGWLQCQRPEKIQALAVDGKVLRGSGRSDGKPLALLSAVSHGLRMTVRSVPIEQKSNEIAALAPLLDGLPLEGCLITADAIHCQQESARLITREHGADYLFGLKGNQSGILQRAQSALSEGAFSPSSL